MTFRETGLDGLVVVELEVSEDERGSFMRTFDAAEWLAHGLEPAVVQCNVSHNRLAGTLRGMHYQAEPHGEAKLVRCSRGAMYDVAVDLRPDSRTRHAWYGLELSEQVPRALYIPRGFAHGFVTLCDDVEVLYQMSAYYEPSAARGVRFDDPAFGIEWPRVPAVISERDRSYPLVES